MLSLLRASARRPLSLALAIPFVLLLAACAPGSSANATPVPTTNVDLPASYRFAPAAISVPAGATVTWTNNDNFTHNVALEGSEPMVMAPGQSTQYTFATPGTYPYVCSLHPKDMKGSVLVSGT
jgi:plastocyanin